MMSSVIEQSGKNRTETKYTIWQFQCHGGGWYVSGVDEKRGWIKSTLAAAQEYAELRCKARGLDATKVIETEIEERRSKSNHNLARLAKEKQLIIR